ncbi:hypothetical protein QVD17_00984 [Tagetes erecta]|uniref:Uncharacterized protein n=1 Tax=Tagetes erecta TaxID=13708 RepID=A0AAD8L661_TARER|nr:hypothetical protein QVD17_00984 [Tagetes erecta]
MEKNNISTAFTLLYTTIPQSQRSVGEEKVFCFQFKKFNIIRYNISLPPSSILQFYSTNSITYSFFNFIQNLKSPFFPQIQDPIFIPSTLFTYSNRGFDLT